MGPYTEPVTREMAAQLSGVIGQVNPVGFAPPAVFPILFLKALRRSMNGIPANSILAKQELEFHGALPVDSDVQVTDVGRLEGDPARAPVRDDRVRHPRRRRHARS